MTGGSVHHSVFRDNKYPDYDAAGKVLSSSLAYADPQAILNLPQDAEIPGVKQLVEAAKAGDGIANFDYEPNGLAGFSPLATQAFMAQNQVSAADFEKFRAEVAKNGFKTRLSPDATVAEIWRKWVAFRSQQTSNYVRRIAESFKAQAPNMRLAITSSRSAGADSLGTLSLGTDNAAMVQFADVIMPQLYSGYSGANAKLVMQMTENWRRELQQQNAKTQLWPLLLVRYSGATVYNSPERLHQQIIGTLAHGANGIGLYYPGNMDGSYWEMLARTTEEIAKTEDFYQKGTRVDAEFPLNALPVAAVKIAMFPDYEETVSNPDWSFTAHRLDGRVLLTLINLDDAKELTFGVDTGKSKVLETTNAKKSGDNQWTVAPGQIGFVTLERQ